MLSVYYLLYWCKVRPPAEIQPHCPRVSKITGYPFPSYSTYHKNALATLVPASEKGTLSFAFMSIVLTKRALLLFIRLSYTLEGIDQTEDSLPIYQPYTS